LIPTGLVLWSAIKSSTVEKDCSNRVCVIFIITISLLLLKIGFVVCCFIIIGRRQTFKESKVQMCDKIPGDIPS